jgi:hypothetical protein
MVGNIPSRAGEQRSSNRDSGTISRLQTHRYRNAVRERGVDPQGNPRKWPPQERDLADFEIVHGLLPL